MLENAGRSLGGLQKQAANVHDGEKGRRICDNPFVSAENTALLITVRADG